MEHVHFHELENLMQSGRHSYGGDVEVPYRGLQSGLVGMKEGGGF